MKTLGDVVQITDKMYANLIFWVFLKFVLSGVS